MIRIIITSIFLLIAIILGVYPNIDSSPLNRILNFFTIETKLNSTHHMLVGIFFYTMGVSISQINSINNYWF